MNKIKKIVVLFLTLGFLCLMIPTAALAKQEPSADVINYDLPKAVVEQPYEAQLLAFDDQGPTTRHISVSRREYVENQGWVYHSGLEDFGLTLGNDGKITGAPNKAARIVFIVEVTWEGSDKVVKLGNFNANRNAYEIECFTQEDYEEKKVTVDTTAEGIPFRKTIDVSADKWFKFTAPTSSFTVETTGRKDPEVLRWDGLTPRTHSAGANPGVHGVTYFSDLGQDYYIHIPSDSPTQTISVKPYQRIEDAKAGTDKYISDDTELKLVAEKVQKEFADRTTKIWDKYVLEETHTTSLGANSWIWNYQSINAVVPFEVGFDNFSVSYSFANTPSDTINDNEPDKKIVVPAGQKCYTFNSYNSFIVKGAANGTGSMSLEIYVPAGKRLKLDADGILRDASIQASENISEKLPPITTDLQKHVEEIRSSILPKLSQEQQNAIDNGGQLDIQLAINETKVGQDVKTAFEKAADKVHLFLDIDPSAVVKDKDGKKIGSAVSITELTKPISITIELPENLRAVGDQLVILRMHDGKVEACPTTYDAATGKLTFTTDKFSKYAIAEKSDKAPKTGLVQNSDNTMLFAAGFFALACLWGAWFIVRKRSEK